MSLKRLAKSYIIACLVAGIISLLFIPSPSGSAILLFIPIMLAFLGPFSFFLVGQYIPVALGIACVALGVAGLILAILGVKKDKANIIHAGNGLWALSGALVTIIALIASCC